MLLLREEKQAAYLSFGLPSSLCSIFLSSIPFVVCLPWFQPWKPLSQANFLCCTPEGRTVRLHAPALGQRPVLPKAWLVKLMVIHPLQLNSGFI